MQYWGKMRPQEPGSYFSGSKQKSSPANNSISVKLSTAIPLIFYQIMDYPEIGGWHLMTNTCKKLREHDQDQ